MGRARPRDVRLQRHRDPEAHLRVDEGTRKDLLPTATAGAAHRSLFLARSRDYFAKEFIESYRGILLLFCCSLTWSFRS